MRVELTRWNFLFYGVLPEIIGKWYTRKHVADEDSTVRIPTVTEKDSGSSMEEYPERYCGQPSYGQMIMCNHKDCKIVWFHFDCLRIRCPPKTKGIVLHVKNSQSPQVHLL